MPIQTVKSPISREELKSIAQERYGDLVKAVVDVEQGIIAIGGELHSDEEVLLMDQEGSKREHTWGINMYPEKSGEDFIQFDSMVNLKPSFGNRSRNVENPETREKIKAIVKKLIIE